MMRRSLRRLKWYIKGAELFERLFSRQLVGESLFLIVIVVVFVVL